MSANELQHKQTQLARVHNAMKFGAWLTLVELHDQTGAPIPSISAHLRALRQPENGRHTIRKRRRGKSEVGLFEYQLQGKPEGAE